MNNKYLRSKALFERSSQVIPLGTQTFSKSYMQYPEGEAPLFIERGEGAKVWDIDGNEYIDLVNGLLPVVLGYKDKDVDRAIKAQLDKGISFSLSSQLEVELAERLVDIIPCAEMVRFGKNGTDATSAAIRLARAYTKRDRVAVCGYHGWQDWYIGATVRKLGIPEAVCELTHRFNFNDIDSLKALMAAHSGEFAAVIIEPMNIAEPQPGFLEEVKSLAHENGAVLIFDEVITGFRYSLGGAQELFGVTPDLASFGKAMGNGMPISAVVGKEDIMSLMTEIFYSGTFAGECLSLAASIAVIDKMKREPVLESIWNKGRLLMAGIEGLVEDLSLRATVSVHGKPSWSLLAFQDHPSARKEVVRSLFIKEMIACGVLIQSSNNISYALSDAQLLKVLDAYKHALSAIASELSKGDIEKRLGFPVIEPVFKVR